MTRESGVVVLGASSGLGAALAVTHARRGDTVTVVARRKERLHQLRDELLSSQPANRWVPIRADLSDAADLTALAGQLLTRPIGRIYLAAAANQPDVAGDVTSRLGLIEPYFRLICCAYISLTEHLIDQSALDSSSEVVVISSLAAVVPFPRLELYSAGKAALEAWCRGTRRRGGPRFAIVRPGLFKSEFFTPSDVLRLDDLPLGRAAKIVQLLDAGRGFVDVGGWRDVAAGRLSSLLGPRAGRVVLHGDLDGSNVLG